MNLSQDRQPLFLAFLLSFLLIALNLYFRPIFPLDETRYISVAWEMWQSNNWLVPHINGETYAHKPPMMFWLMNLSWAIFGVNEWSARIVVPLLASLNFILIRRLSLLIYDDNTQAANYSPLILLSFTGWFLYVPMSMFDLLLTVFVLSYVICIWRFAQTQRWSFIFWAGVSLGIGMLVKGPVILIYTITVFILYFMWRRENMISTGKLLKAGLISLILGGVIVLSWAIPAAIAGGEEYAQAIFWGQSAGRMKDSFAHARPFYWFVMILPILLLPWIFLRGMWQTKNCLNLSKNDRFLLAWFFLVVLIFSCISGKQIHYVFPVFPALAIFLAAKVDIKKFRKESFLAIILLLLAVLIFSGNLWVAKAFPVAQNPQINILWGIVPLFLSALMLLSERLGKHYFKLVLISFPLGIYILIPALSSVLTQIYDVTETATFIHQKQEKGIVVAHMGKYHNQFQFSGRLEQPLVILDQDQSQRNNWLKAHPDALVILTVKKADDFLVEKSEYTHPFRGRLHIIIRAEYLSQWYKQQTK
ncbi:MAG: 4-amino-4-deoxy-L-arabinose transferase-like glycosyltransferase [Psychromonas sp.]|jgi:4-amino-4-deoxy-L-arabinose transferase-like glycosyltransferase|uniref:ArnT family glycosyltransferase n=1 Tax=Psychromonas sp. TaxID=1884585 RepID=UPI0039E45508